MSYLFGDDDHKEFDHVGKEAAIKYFTSLGYLYVENSNKLGIDLIFVKDFDDIIYVDAAVNRRYDFPLTELKERKPRWRECINIVKRIGKYRKWYPGRAYVFELSVDLSEAFLLCCDHLTDDKLTWGKNKRYPDGEHLYKVHVSRTRYCKL